MARLARAAWDWWRGAGALRLADGRAVRLRAVRPQDAPAEQAFVTALSPTSRYLRFHYGAAALPDALLRRMTAPDPAREVALVAEAGGAIVADARCVFSPAGGEAEFAIVVADGWQRLGLGRRLLARLALEARRRGARQLLGDVLSTNARMIGMLRRQGASFERVPGDALVLRARIALAGPAESAARFEESACFDPI